MPLFHIGQDYTRRQIHNRIGGSLQNALPTVNNVVVAACLHADAAYNPDAPDVVLCGRSDRVSAAGELLASQPEPIHVFLFHARNRWEYRGLFRAKASYTEGSEFDRWVSRGQRSPSAISRVVLLERLPQA